MQDTLITIVIPCYNCEKTVGKCIDSVVKQTYRNLQIIAINDGSTDNTLEVLKARADNDDRITVINQSNSGVSATRNLGIEEAKGEYISFIDADDYVEKEFIEKLFTEIIGNDAELSLCQYSTGIINQNQALLANQINSKGKLIYEMMLPRLDIAAFVWNRLFRIDVLKKYGIRYNETVYACEDTLFNYQYMKRITRFAVCREHLYHYVINENSAMFGNDFNQKKLTANIAFDIMLADCNKEERKAIEIATMWFNLILKRQIYKKKAAIEKFEMETINKMLSLNPKAFMNSNVGLKYKIAYPFWRYR